MLYFQVDEAAKFLMNPSVVGHGADKKKAFLRKKGLSEAEIDAAFGKVQVPGVSMRSLDQAALPWNLFERQENVHISNFCRS